MSILKVPFVCPSELIADLLDHHCPQGKVEFNQVKIKCEL
jgi:pterin-4a-carbinolamine dehydratase